MVVTWFRDRDGAEATRRRVEEAGRRAHVAHLDVRDPTEVAQLFERTERELGTPYILVNNADMDSTGKHVAEMQLEDWDNELKTNLYGPFHCCQHFIRARKSAGGQGKIINVTGAPGDPARAPCRRLQCRQGRAAQPHAHALPRACPGSHQRQQHRSRHGAHADEPVGDRRPQAARAAGPEHSWKRAAEPCEVARLAVYLASEEADYVTG